MEEQPALSFARLLRQLRDGAGLTQEELAEAASLSPRSVSDLERGIHRTARKDTALLLADALSLAEPTRGMFVAAARGRAPAAEALAAGQHVPGTFAAAATRSLPRDIAGFIGRQAELAQLLTAVAAAAGGGGVVGIHAIDGMAGIGKTTLAVHAAHRLAAAFPDGQFFLPMHAHTPGQRPVKPADALASLLLTAGVAAAAIPPSAEARAARWRDHAAGKKILLVLDDAAGHEQVRPLLPAASDSLVLITSRRRLTALEDAAQISLDTLPPGDAAAMLVRLAARPGIHAGDAAVGEITRLCGYLPLALGMIASQLRNHPTWSCGQLAAELAAARDRLAVMRAENLSVAAAFDLSYADLSPAAQRLFRRLGLVEGPSIDICAAAALDGVTLDAARRQLDELYDQHLAAEPAAGRYQLHDLVREHARALAARDDQLTDRDQATGRLLAYYRAAAGAADRRLTRYTRPGDHAPAAASAPATLPELPDSTRALRWARAERANLLACLDQATAAGQHARVAGLTAAMAAFLRHDGPWADAITRHVAAVQATQRLGDRLAQANALLDLGVVWHETGQYPDAAGSLQAALAIYRDLGDRLGQANVIRELGVIGERTGQYPDAAGVLEEALGIYHDVGDPLGQANALVWLGHMRSYMRQYPAATSALETALGIFGNLGDRLGQAGTLWRLGQVRLWTGNYQSAAELMQAGLDASRDLGDGVNQARALQRLAALRCKTGDYADAAEDLEVALGIARDLGSRLDEGLALWGLGVVRQLTGDHQGAAEVLETALAIHRDLGALHNQADTLTSLGIVRRLTGDYRGAAQALQEAQHLCLRIGDRQCHAEALNATGTLRRAQGSLRQARACHRQALQLARDIASPWNEADALAGLGRCAQTLGRTTETRHHLRQAVEIFQRIGAAEATQVSAELDALTQVPPPPNNPEQ